MLPGGITDVSRLPADRVYLRARADRFTNALWVYRAGGCGASSYRAGRGRWAPRLVVKPPIWPRRCAWSPCRPLAFGWKRAAVISAKMRSLPSNCCAGVDMPVLVTSAFHMRWAEGCFARPLAWKVGSQASGRALTPAYWLLPSPEAIEPAAARNGRLGRVQGARLVLRHSPGVGSVPVAR